MCRLFFLVVTSLVVITTLVKGMTQSTGVQGKLICDGAPADNVYLKLYDVHEKGKLDALMAEGVSNDRGEFTITGFVDSDGAFNPKINIYHDCNDGFKPCQRKFEIFIPKNFTSHMERPSKLYQLGVIDLSEKWGNETRDCFH